MADIDRPGFRPPESGQASNPVPPRAPLKNSQRQVPHLAHSPSRWTGFCDGTNILQLLYLLAFLRLSCLVDVAASQTATMLYEMIGIVSNTVLLRLGNYWT